MTAIQVLCVLWWELGEFLLHLFNMILQGLHPAYLHWLCRCARGRESSFQEFVCSAASEPAPHTPLNQPLLVPSPGAPSHGAPSLAVVEDTPALVLALAPAVPRCNLYIFCHVQELFVIYCMTAVKIYFAIRGGKLIALACFVLFFSLRLLGWGELQESTEDGSGSRIRYVGFLFWERWLLWGDFGKSLVRESLELPVPTAGSCVGLQMSYFPRTGSGGRGVEIFMPLSDPGLEAPGTIIGG